MSSESPQALVALDAFGHIRMCDPPDLGRFFLSRSLAPELVTESDVLEYDLTGEPVTPTGAGLYSERINLSCSFVCDGM